MRIHASAFKHNLTEADTDHAWQNAIAFFDLDPDNDPAKSLCIGADAAGNLLELLYLQLEDADPIIHAMQLRPVFAQFLTKDEL